MVIWRNRYFLILKYYFRYANATLLHWNVSMFRHKISVKVVNHKMIRKSSCHCTYICTKLLLFTHYSLCVRFAIKAFHIHQLLLTSINYYAYFTLNGRLTLTVHMLEKKHSQKKEEKIDNMKEQMKMKNLEKQVDLKAAELVKIKEENTSLTKRYYMFCPSLPIIIIEGQDKVYRLLYKVSVDTGRLSSELYYLRADTCTSQVHYSGCFCFHCLAKEKQQKATVPNTTFKELRCEEGSSRNRNCI